VPRTLLDADGASRDLAEFRGLEQPAELGLGELREPALVGLDLVAALELEVVRVAEAAWEIAEELAPAAQGFGRWFRGPCSGRAGG
jgi:hypothetical protein